MTQLYSGGLIFNGENEILDGQSLLVESGKISKVGPTGEFDGFDGDLTDLTERGARTGSWI